MKAVLAVSAAALFSGALAQSKVTVNTPPQLIECQPIQISWSGGTPPYFPSIFPDGNPATTLEQFNSTSATSLTWTVNIASGQSVGFAVGDSTGVVGQSASVNIQPGTTTSCVGQSASGSAVAGTTGSSPASTGGSSGASTTAASGSSGTSGSSSATKSAGSSSGSSSTTSTSPSTSSNAASSQSAQVGFAGIVGAALVALFA